MIEVIGWFGFPVFVIFSVIPSLILLDYTREHRIRYTRKVALRMGITEELRI